MNPAVTQDPFILGPTKRASAPDKKPIVQPDTPAAADPFLLGVGDNISSKKKVGGEPYGTATAPTESISESLSVSTEPTNPTSFLSKDIEESQNKWDDIANFRDMANPDPITPTLPDTPEKKEEKKRQILSEPEQLKKYRQERIAAIQDDIADLKNNKLAKYIDFSMQQAGIPTTQTSYTEGAQPILDEISAKQKYLEEFNNNVKNVAAYAVASKEDLSEVSDAKLKQIGEKYLSVVGDRSLKDDLEVLRTMDATGASRVDAERTGENINFRLYTSGANALARYYSDVAQDSFEKAQSQLAEINRLQNKQSEAKTQSEKDAYGTAITALMQDENVKTAIESERNAMTYADKSRNAIDQFPQVKRRAMRQQLNDAYFTLLQAKQGTAGATPASLGYKIGNWLFGDEATEEDVPTLAKMVGMSEEEVRDIVKTNIKGWFGSADEAGVRVPGMLTGIAQASDETLAKAAMGTKRFFNVDNVEAKNRMLSDRIQDYNLKAQKAKLFDDSGKLNFNPFSVFNTMGAGIGQTAVYAAPSMLTGGLASGLAASEKVGKLMSLGTTTGSGFAGSYEDAYKEAAKYTDDEEKRRAYATKIGLVNGLSETILEPAEVAKKVGFGAKNNKDAFDAFVKMYDKKGAGAAMAEGLKEFGKVVGTENLEELIALVGETKFKESDLGVVTPPGEFINNAIETAITTTLTTLPLGIGAGMNGTRDQSGIVKQGLFEAGNEPELYQSKLKDLLDNGSINQDQYNNRVAVVNTMAQIVPTIKPTDINGNKLSYSQKSELAAQQFRILNNNRMLEDKNLVEAEKPLIEADTKDAIEKQTNILTGQPVEQMVDETPATPQEDLQNDIRNDLISKIQNIETNNATVNFMKGQPEDAISFIQEQATGMTTSRDDADVPTYNETVNMFGQDIVDQAVSILPQDQKDMIIKSWDAKGLEIPAPLMQAVRSTNTTDNENKSNQSSSQEAEQTSEESGNGIGEEGQEDVLETTEQQNVAAPVLEQSDVVEEKRSSPRKKINTIEQAEEELKTIFSPSSDRLIEENMPVGVNESTAQQYLTKAEAVLKQLYPNSTITSYESADEYYEKEKRPQGSAGVFHPDGRLALNLELIRKHGAENTIFHEVIHPIVNEAIVGKEGSLSDAWGQLQELKEVPGMQAVFDHVAAYQGRGIDVQKVEGITEFLTQVADGKIDISKVPTSTAAKIIDLINNIFKSLGINIQINNASDLGKLSKAIKDAFEQADAAPVASLLGNRNISSSGESFDALSPKQQEDAVRDFINRSRGLDETQLKSLIKKYTGWSDEKIDGLFEEQPEGGGNEERKFTKQVLADKAIPKPTKAEIRKNLDYMRQTNAMSAAEAEKILNTVPVDEAYDIVVNDRDIKPAARVVLGQALIKKYNQLALDAKNEEDRSQYIQKTIDTADFVAEKLGTIPGQMIQALSLYKRLSPEAQIKRATREARQNGTKRKQKTSKQVDEVGRKLQQVNEETADEITKSKPLNEKIKQAKEKRTRSAEDKIAKARKRREELKAKYKSQKGGALYAGVGLTKEGIEYVGNLAKTYIDEGIAELSIIVDNIISDLRQASGKEPTPEVVSNVGDIISDQLNKRANAIVAENLKTLESDISKIIKEHYTVTQEQKQSLTQKFVAEAGLPQQEAAELAKEVESEFDRIATRKKRAILDQEKKRFDRIQKGLEGAKKTDKPQLGDDIIRYTNLGAFDNADLLDMIAEKLGTGALTPEQIKRIQDLADKVQKAPEGSPKNKATEDLLAYQADIKGTNWGEVTQAIWYANVLSGYSTHLKNIISTFFNGMSFAAAEAVRDPRSIPIIFMGGVRGAKRGAVEAWHTVTTGETPIHIRAIDVPDVLERKEFVGGNFNPANYLKYVGRAMKAEDVLQFQALKEMRATQLAYRDAKKKGLTNPFSPVVWKEINNTLLNTKDRFNEATQQATSEGFSGPELKRRTLELMEQSRPIQLTEDAYGFAAKGTFNHDTEGTLGALNDLASQVLDLNIGGVKPLRFVVPFTRILTNVANNAIDFSPLGLIRGARGVRGFEKFSGRIQDKYHVMTPEERAQVISRAALGTAVMAALYVMTKLKGDDDEPILEITGGGTGDYKKDAQLKQGGWQPYSIKVGDKYISYALSPLAFSLGLLGNINDHEKYSKGADEEGLIQKTTMAVWQGSKLLADMTWIGSSAGILGALGNDNPAAMEKELTNIVANSAKSFVIPNLYSQVASEYQRLYSIPQKETRHVYDRFIQDIPIARNLLNDKINALGDPVIRDTDLLLSGTTTSDNWAIRQLLDKQDSVMKFMLDNKVWAAPVNKNSLIIYDWDKGEERSATPDEYYNFSKLRGQKIKESIRELMSSGVSFSAEGKPTISDDGITEYRIASSVTTKQLQSQITELSKKATKEAKAELNFQKPKN